MWLGFIIHSFFYLYGVPFFFVFVSSFFFLFFLFLFSGTLSSLGGNLWDSWNGRIETVLGSKKIGMSRCIVDVLTRVLLGSVVW